MAAPQKNMPAPNLPIDPKTGRVPVTDKKTGKVRWLHPVDAKEQLSNMLKDEKGKHIEPAVRLSTPVEAPPKTPTPLIDWPSVPFEELREHAQNAGITFHARTRLQIEDELVQMGYVPPQDVTE